MNKAAFKRIIKNRLAFLCIVLFGFAPAIAYSQTYKFVYAFDSSGNLLTPNNAHSYCPDPSNQHQATRNCRGVLVDSDSNYSMRLDSETIPSTKSLVLVANEYQFIPAGSTAGIKQDTFILVQSNRRIDDVVKDATNSGLNINVLSEHALKAVENLYSLVQQDPGTASSELCEFVQQIDASALNYALGNTPEDNVAVETDFERALIEVHQPSLEASAKTQLLELATLAVQSLEDEKAQSYIRKNIIQGMVEPVLLSEVKERVFSHLSALQVKDSGQAIVTLEADRYVVHVDDVAELNTLKSLHPEKFFAYTWNGVQSDTRSAQFSKGDSGSFLVCVTGEASQENESSTDCVRLVVKDQIEAVAALSERRIAIGGQLLASAKHSIGATTFQWSGAGQFVDENAETTHWTAPSIPGVYELTLTIDEGETDTVSVQVFDVLPVALATADKYLVYLDQVDPKVTLTSHSLSTDGTGVDAIEWKMVSAPEGSTSQLASPTAKSTSFTPTVAGAYVISLRADRAEHTDTIDVVIQARNPGDPFANAGENRIAFRNQAVTLDGSLSYVDAGRTASFLWSADGGVIATPTKATTRFNSTTIGQFTATLAVSDGRTTSTDRVTIDVRNRLPSASDDVIANPLNELIVGQLVAHDGDLDPLRYEIVSQPRNGGITLDETTGAFIYAPGGDKGCRYRPYSKPFDNDKGGKDVPVIKLCADKYIVAPGETITLTTSASIHASQFSGITWSEGVVEVDLQTATYTPTEAGPHHLCVVGNVGQSNNTSTACVDIEVDTGLDPNDYYVLDSGYVDRFQIRVNDGIDYSNTATILLTLGWENSAPVAEEQSGLSTEEDQPIRGSVRASDIDGHPLTYKIVSNGNLGTATLLDTVTGAFIYEPHPNAFGVDAFSFQAYDGLEHSNIATVSLRIDGRDDIPVAAYNGVLTTLEDTPVNGLMTSIDPDNDVLEYRLVTNGQKGVVALTNPKTGAFVYTPNDNETGNDRIAYLVNDGVNDSNIAWIDVTITPINDAPKAEDLGPLSVNEDQSLTAQLNGSDVDGDTIEYKIISQPSLGTVSSLDTDTGAFTYTPNANAYGDDSFSYRTQDGKLESETATVRITITPINDTPIAQDMGTLITDEDTPLQITLKATDADQDVLTYTLVSSGNIGTAVINNASTGAVTYSPALNASGNDTLQFKANDGKADSNIATVYIGVTAKNDTPVAHNASFTIHANKVFKGKLAASDADQDALIYRVVAASSKGTVAITDPATGSYEYTPTGNNLGQDSFTFNVSDGSFSSVSATVTITVLAANDAPVAHAQNITVFEGVPYGGTLSASDPDQDPLEFSVSKHPGLGEVELNVEPNQAGNSSFVYTPKNQAKGNDYFAFTVTDGYHTSQPASVAVNILPLSQVCAGPMHQRQDQDGDGYADVVELAFGANPSLATSTPAGLNPSDFGVSFTDDDDDDGYPDLAEIWLGSDPNNAASMPSDSSLRVLPACLKLEQDFAPPSLLGFHIVDNPLDVSDGNTRARFSISVVDNAAGMQTVAISLRSPSGVKLNANLPVQGGPTTLYKTFSSEPFSQYAEAGIWLVDSITLTDVLGHSVELKTPQLKLLGYDTELQIVNPNSDPQACNLQHFEVLTPSVDVSSGTAVASFRYIATDNLSGIARVFVKLESPSKAYRWGEVKLTGNQTYIDATIDTNAFASFSEAGIWQVSELTVNDEAGNQFTLNNAALRARGYSTEVQVNNGGPGDTTPPTLEQFSVLTPVVYPAPGNVSAEYAVTASDAESGLREIFVELTSPSGNTKLAASFRSLETLALLTTRLQSKAFASVTEAGLWHINLVKITDAAGNVGRWNEQDLIGLNFDHIVEVRYYGGCCGINHLPEAYHSVVATDEDTPVNDHLRAYDADGDALIYQLVTNAAFGKVSITNADTGAFRYQPNKNFHGNDSFSFQVHDGYRPSNVATVSIVVNPVNDAPVAEDAAITVIRDQSHAGLLQATDVENDPLTFSIVEGGSKGTAVMLDENTGVFQYTPNPGVTGTDVFRFQVSDATKVSNIAEVSVNIKAALAVTGFEVLTPVVSGNDASIWLACGVTLSAEIGQFSEARIDLMGPSGQKISMVSSVTGSYPFTIAKTVLTNGVPLEPGIWTFANLQVKKTGVFFSIPINDGFGNDNFDKTVQVLDNTSPVAPSNTNYTMVLGETLNETLLATDAEGHSLQFAIQAQPNQGMVNIVDAETGAFQYQPTTIGVDSFTYRANDSVGTSNLGRVNITVQPPNAGPVAYPMSVQAVQGLAYVDYLLAEDPERDPLTYELVAQTGKGVVSILNSRTGEFVYQASANSTGEDRFSFRVYDGSDYSQSAEVSITIEKANGIPVAYPAQIVVFENLPYQGQLRAVDADDDPLTYTLHSQANLGTVTLDPDSGRFDYVPDPNRFGADVFRYSVSDGKNSSQVVSVNIDLQSSAQVCGQGGIFQQLDSDKDGYADVVEIAFATQPNDPLSTPAGLNEADLGISYSDDDDLDGYADYVETWLGSDPYKLSSAPNQSLSVALPECFHALSDGIDPRLIGFHILSDVVDLNAGDTRVRFALTLLDNASGLKRVRINLQSPSGNLVTASATFTERPLLKALQLDSPSLGEFAEQGTWRVTGITVYDHASNRLDINQSDLVEAGLPYQVQVSNSFGDALPPTLVNFQIATTTVYPGAGNEVMSFVVNAADTGSGVASIRVEVMSPSGIKVSAATSLGQQPTSISTVLDTPVLSIYAEQGLWRVVGVLLVDGAGNSNQLGDQLENLGFSHQVQVTNPISDTLAPRLDGFSILSASLHPLTEDARMSFAVQASDDLSGIQAVAIDIRGPSGQIISAWGGYSGDYPRLANAQVETASLSSLLEVGQWQVETVEIIDEAGNRQLLFTDDLIELGYNTLLSIVQ